MCLSGRRETGRERRKSHKRGLETDADTSGGSLLWGRVSWIHASRRLDRIDNGKYRRSGGVQLLTNCLGLRSDANQMVCTFDRPTLPQASEALPPQRSRLPYIYLRYRTVLPHGILSTIKVHSINILQDVAKVLKSEYFHNFCLRKFFLFIRNSVTIP